MVICYIKGHIEVRTIQKFLKIRKIKTTASVIKQRNRNRMSTYLPKFRHGKQLCRELLIIKNKTIL